MEKFRYLSNVSTLHLDTDICIGCGMCETVCPHSVFDVKDKKARVLDKDACMECGACANNCPVEAISVTPGVGCAAYIIQTWVKKTGLKSGSETSCC